MKKSSLFLVAFIITLLNVNGQIVYNEVNVILDDHQEAFEIVPSGHVGTSPIQLQLINYDTSWSFQAVAETNIDATVGDDTYAGMGMYYVDALSSGDLIQYGAGGTWFTGPTGVSSWSLFDALYSQTQPSMFQADGTDQYFGCRIGYNGSTKYHCWVRINITTDDSTSSGYKIIIKDWAYNSVEDSAIYAGEGLTQSVTGVSLDQSTLNLTVGGTAILTSTITPSNSTDQTVNWSTSDTSIVIVSNGIVTAKGPGTATITVTTVDGGFTAGCVVNVSSSVSPPVADFSASSTYIGENDTVIFTDLSSNTPTAWSWNFGDGYASTMQNPMHSYSIVGKYTVALTVTNNDGSNTETKTNYITVNSSVVDSGQSVTYENIPTIGDSYTGLFFNTTDGGGYGDHYHVYATNASSESSGENVTWDFSNVPTTGETKHQYSMSFADPTNFAPQNMQFPGANIVSVSDGFDNRNWYEKSGSDTLGYRLLQKGYGNDDLTSFGVYDNNNTIISTATYGEAPVSESFNMTVNDNSSMSGGCTSTFEVDAFGTLILPQGTFTNVVRTKRVFHFDGYMGMMGVTDDAEYMWFADGEVAPLFSYKKSVVDGDTTKSVFYNNVIQSGSNVAVTGITISQSTLNMSEGGTATLTATIIPSNATDQIITWTTSDTSVAVVSNGVVTAKGAGTSTITVTTNDGGYTATCAVTATINESFSLTSSTHMPENTDVFSMSYFNSGTVEGAFLDTLDPDIIGGASRAWDFSSIPLKGTPQTITFADAATREPHTSIYFPTSTIVYHDDMNSGTPYIFLDSTFSNVGASNADASYYYIYSPARKRIVFPSSYGDAIINDTSNIDINGSLQYDLFFTYQVDAWGSLTLPGKTYPDVVRVKRTCKSNGFGGTGVEDDYEYYWYAPDIKWPVLYYNNSNIDGANTIKLSHSFTSPTSVTGISINKSTLNLTEGDTAILSTVITPSNATDQIITWTTSDTSVVVVSNGVVTAKGAGTSTITVTTNDGGYTATCDVVVASLVVVTGADFNYYADSLSKTTLYFTDASSSGITTWYWTFGEGSYSKEQNPTHVFNEAGVYNVCLFVLNANLSTTADTCKEVTVGNIACKAKYSYLVTDLTNAISLIDQSLGSNYSLYWTFGDGYASTNASPQHIYSEAGVYTVGLAIQNSALGCNNYYEEQIEVGTISCLADFSFFTNPDTKEVTLTDNSSGTLTNWFWSFGDGSYSFTQEPVHIYANTGLYKVTLAVGNNTAECMSSAEKEIQVGTINCKAHFTSYIDSASNTAYFNSNVTGSTPSLYWEFGDGDFSSEENPVKQYTQPGYYYVSLSIYDTATLCMDYYSEVILISHTGIDCEANFTWQATGQGKVQFKDKSNGLNISGYTWDFGDGETSTDKNPQHNYTETGYFNVCLTVKNTTNSCKNSSCKYIKVDETKEGCQAKFVYTVDKTTKTIKCFDRSLGNIDNWEWNFGDSIIKNDQDPEHTYAKEGYYGVYVKVWSSTNDKCRNQHLKYINVGKNNEGLKATFGYDTDTTDNSKGIYPTDFTGAGYGTPASFAWSFGDGNSNVTTISPTHVYDAAGTYNVCFSVSDPNINQSDTLCKNIVIETVGINEITKHKTEINLYPNPSNGTFTIEINPSTPLRVHDNVSRSLSGVETTTITNIQGKIIHHQAITQPKTLVDVSDLANGIYYLQVNTGEELVTKKIVVLK